MSPSNRLLIANLDLESDLLRQAGGEPKSMSLAATKAIAGYGTLMRALAEDGDTLWTPASVEAERVVEVPGLPNPELTSGDLPDRLATTLAWGKTREIHARRSNQQPEAAGGRWWERVWMLEPPPPEAVRRCHDRRFFHRTALALGCLLPGARLVSSLAELQGHLEDRGLDGSPERRWVVKAPFDAAGRHRILGQGTTIPESDRSGIESLLEAQDQLLFEPWLERVDDFGAVALRYDEHTEICGLHRQQVDGAGRFQGLELVVDRPLPERWLSAEDLRLMEHLMLAVGDLLGREGYRGPFGIDAWRYWNEDGEKVLNPLGEINVRFTFGHLAHAMASRVGTALGWPAGSGATLRLEQRKEPVEAEEGLAVLQPGSGSPFAAWWER